MKRLPVLLLVVAMLFSCSGGDDVSGGEVQADGSAEAASQDALLLLPEGGMVAFSDELSFAVEPGAVSAEVDLVVQPLSDGVDEILAQSVWNDFELLGGFAIDAEDLELDQPVGVTMNLAEFPSHPGYPLILKVDPDLETYRLAASEIEYNPATGQIRFTLDGFSHVAVVWKENDAAINECESPATACRCGWIKVTTEASDFMSDTCQIVSQDIEIQFMSCPDQPVETDHMSEALGCEWYGTFDFYIHMYEQGAQWFELHLLMDTYFTLDSNGIVGSGVGRSDFTMHDYVIPECSWLVDEADFNVVITGEWDPDLLHINLLPDAGMEGTQLGANCPEMMLEEIPINWGVEMRNLFMERTWDVPHQPITDHRIIVHTYEQDEWGLLVDLVPGEYE